MEGRKKEELKFVLLCSGVAFFAGFFLSKATYAETESKRNDMQYSASEITTSKENAMARITIDDSYKKAGVKYYEFFTDLTYNKKFILSEEEYDKYIGTGNDAVDSTIYSLDAKTVILSTEEMSFTERLKYGSFRDLRNSIESIDGIELYPKDPFEYAHAPTQELSISHAFGQNFDRGEFTVNATFTKNSVLYEDVFISVNLNKKRYSFVGESDFSASEIAEDQDVYEKIISKVAEICIPD